MRYIDLQKPGGAACRRWSTPSIFRGLAVAHSPGAVAATTVPAILVWRVQKDRICRELQKKLDERLDFDSKEEESRKE